MISTYPIINQICFYKTFLNKKSNIYKHKETQSRKLLTFSSRKNGFFHAKILMKGWLYSGAQLGILKGRGDLRLVKVNFFQPTEADTGSVP